MCAGVGVVFTWEKSRSEFVCSFVCLVSWFLSEATSQHRTKNCSPLKIQQGSWGASARPERWMLKAVLQMLWKHLWILYQLPDSETLANLMIFPVIRDCYVSNIWSTHNLKIFFKFYKTLPCISPADFYEPQVKSKHTDFQWRLFSLILPSNDTTIDSSNIKIRQLGA